MLNLYLSRMALGVEGTKPNTGCFYSLKASFLAATGPRLPLAKRSLIAPSGRYLFAYVQRFGLRMPPLPLTPGATFGLAETGRAPTPSGLLSRASQYRAGVKVAT